MVSFKPSLHALLNNFDGFKSGVGVMPVYKNGVDESENGGQNRIIRLASSNSEEAISSPRNLKSKNIFLMKGSQNKLIINISYNKSYII